MPKAKGHHKGNKLSATFVRTVTKRGHYPDGHNLWLQVSKSGTKSWLFRYTLEWKAKVMGLGALHTVSLAEARKRAAEFRLLKFDGVDPLADKKAKRLRAKFEAAKAMTFKQCAEAYIEANRAGWRNAMHAAQWPSTLEAYAYPIFGDLPVASVDVALVTKALEPIWQTKTETASRLRGRIEAVLDWAKVRGYRDGENPARWRGHLEQILPRPSKVARVEHLAALPFADVPAFMLELRGKESVAARALEFTILTAARTGEAFGAKWTEIDVVKKVWELPPGRTKAARAHAVPLSDRALAILESLPREGETIFAVGRGESVRKLLKGMRPDVTIHGFRSSFRDWAGDATHFPREVAEAALAHATGDETERAYRRGDALAKRRELMNAWASYLEREPADDGKVVPLRAAQ